MGTSFWINNNNNNALNSSSSPHPHKKDLTFLRRQFK